ncbi:MAG TPA: hypothetical protein VII29_09215 [Terriglobales bacterium]|jgi:hypothetical protein
MRETSRRDSGKAVLFMSTEEVFVQQFAKLFVHYRDALTQDAGPASDRRSHVGSEVPCAERERMVAAARLALVEIESSPMEESRRYYAKPGEAEWGC